MRRPLCRTAVVCDLILHSSASYVMLKYRASMTCSDFDMLLIWSICVIIGAACNKGSLQ
jgi:hypothetical protein